jgi:hypothetical protein
MSCLPGRTNSLCGRLRELPVAASTGLQICEFDSQFSYTGINNM